MRRFARWQGKAVDRLELRPGNAVIDVACGTGLNFPLLQDKIGAGGRIVGIDLSADMIAIARERVASHDWHNVTLIEAAAEEAKIPLTADAALFSFAHDVLQSSTAVANVVAHLHPDARVASVGAKYANGWNPVVNFFVRRSARPYVTTFHGLDRPWRELERYAGEMQSEALALGGAYVAWGQVSRAGSDRELPG
jgi:ubiquinone/menaquinone biosynthesis C-methylase UbiE